MAIVVHGGRYSGRLVDVLYAAPPHRFELPDGFMHSGVGPCGWVIHSLGSPFEAPLGYNGLQATRAAMYGVIWDKYLRPLRDGETETHETKRTVMA
jgi:hypothetical protein